MLEAICGELRNYFVKSVIRGLFKVASGKIDLPLADGQWYRIKGSVFNDGVHKYGSETLVDEEFNGEVWAMAVPPRLVELADAIKAFEESAPVTPYTSESWNGYSYSVATQEGGAPVRWQTAFARDLNEWRKI